MAADPQALQLLPFIQLLLSKKQKAEGHFAEPRPGCFKVHRICDWSGQPFQVHHTQPESYQLLRLLPGQFQLCCLYPSLHQDAHLLKGLPGLLTLTLQPILHPEPATEVHCYLPARRNGSSKKAGEFVVYMDSQVPCLGLELPLESAVFQHKLLLVTDYSR